MNRIFLTTAACVLLTGCLHDVSETPVNDIEEVSLWNFAITENDIEATTKSNRTYYVLKDVGTRQSNRFRTFDLVRGQVELSDGATEPMKLIDTLILDGQGYQSSVKRYVYGMGKFDGLNIVAVSQVEDKFLYTLNTTSKKGVIDSIFLEIYRNQGFEPELLTLNLPAPPPPPPPSVFSDSL